MRGTTIRRTNLTLRWAGHPSPETVERWVPGANVRRDYLGLFDIITAMPYAKHRVRVLAGDGTIEDQILPYPAGIVGVQTTTSDHAAAHLREIADSADKRKNLRIWLEAGGGFEIWAWRKRATFRGSGLLVWTARVLTVGWDEEGDAPAVLSSLDIVGAPEPPPKPRRKPRRRAKPEGGGRGG